MLKKNYLSSLITIATLFVMVFYLLTSKTLAFVNSDFFSIPHLFKDLFWEHGSLSDWVFPPAVYFFPDFFLFSFFGLLTQNLWVSTFCTCFTVYFLYYYFLVSIGTMIGGNSCKNLFRLSALVSFLLAYGHFSDQEIFVPPIVSHFSTTVVMYLASLFLVLKEFKTPQKSTYVALLILCFVSIFSDPLLFAFFFGSILPAMIAVKFRKYSTIRVVILIAVGLFAYLSSTHDWFHLHLMKMGERFVFDWARVLRFRDVFAIYYTNNPIPFIISAIFFIMGNVFFWKCTLFKQYQQDDLTAQNRFFVLIAIAFCINVVIFTGILMDRSLMVPGYFGMRYFQPSIILPMTLGLPMILAQLEPINRIINRYYYYFLSAILICLFLFQPLGSFVDSPVETQCLDDYYDRGELSSKDGFASYWNARRNGILSKNNLNIVAVSRELLPMYWLNTKHDYNNKSFSFVLLNSGDMELTSQTVIQKLGEPQKKLICPQNPQVSIYAYSKPFEYDILQH